MAVVFRRALKKICPILGISWPQWWHILTLYLLQQAQMIARMTLSRLEVMGSKEIEPVLCDDGIMRWILMDFCSSTSIWGRALLHIFFILKARSCSIWFSCQQLCREGGWGAQCARESVSFRCKWSKFLIGVYTCCVTRASDWHEDNILATVGIGISLVHAYMAYKLQWGAHKSVYVEDFIVFAGYVMYN